MLADLGPKVIYDEVELIQRVLLQLVVIFSEQGEHTRSALDARHPKNVDDRESGLLLLRCAVLWMDASFPKVTWLIDALLPSTSDAATVATRGVGPVRRVFPSGMGCANSKEERG